LPQRPIAFSINPASVEQNQIGRIDTGALRTTAPAMLRYDQFLVGCRMAARSSLSMP
jgi:hypothetical protein